MSTDVIKYGMNKNLDVTSEQVELIKRTVAVGATDDELKLFIYDCQRRGVHPLDRMIFFVKRKVKEEGSDERVGKACHQTSVDFLRSQADLTKAFAGMDEIEYDDAPSGDYPTKATATVYKMVDGARVPFTATVRWIEFFPGEKQGFMWKRMPYHMLGKCAEAQALRKAFPQQLQGLYVEEELQREIIDVTPEKKLSETVQEKLPPPEKKAAAKNTEKAAGAPPAGNTPKEDVRTILKSELSNYCKGDLQKIEKVLPEISAYKKGTKDYSLKKFTDIDDTKVFEWRIENALKALRERVEKEKKEAPAPEKPPIIIEGCTQNIESCDHSLIEGDNVLCHAMGDEKCPFHSGLPFA